MKKLINQYLELCDRYGKAEMEKLIGLKKFISETKKHGSIFQDIQYFFNG